MELQKKINELLELDPYNLSEKKKKQILLDILLHQLDYHLCNCEPYKLWYKRNSFKDVDQITSIEEIPFVPSSVFKHLDLRTGQAKSKKVQSSGTTSKYKSKIFLDSQTSKNQVLALSKILSSNIGKKRKTFFICDVEPGFQSKTDISLSARFAGMSGYLLAAKNRYYLLKYDEKGNITFNDDSIKILKLSQDEEVVLIGYTYMIWEHFINNSISKFKLNLNEKTKLIHFGGWKKLANKQVDKSHFLQQLNVELGIQSNCVFDIYGFTEQLGTVYPSKGNSGSLVSTYSDVLVRDTATFEVLDEGEEGFLQFISILPTSYPGFSILNDDLGYIKKRNTSENSLETKEFVVLSRLEKADARGCGDTLPENFYI